MVRVRILLILSWVVFFLKNWRHFDFYEHFIKNFHIRKVKCLVRGGCRFGGWNQVTILDRRVTSFPGFFPKVSLSRPLGQVGENPENEVGNRVENVHFMLRLHNRSALIEVRCSVRKLFSWPHVTKWCDNEAIACAICNDLKPTMTLLYYRTHVKFLYINTHSLSKICCDSACPFMW